LQEESPSPQRSIIQILLVDDEVDQIETTRMYLEDIDPRLKITGVATPEAVLDHLEKRVLDCIVLDYMMPGMNGVDLARKIRETSEVPIIIYTGHGSEEVAEAAFQAGIDDYVRKESGPAHFKVLAKRIRTHIDHHHSRISGRVYHGKIEALHLNAAKLATAESIEEIAEVTFGTLRQVLGFELGGIAIVEGGKLKVIKNTATPGRTIELPLEGKGISVRAVRTGKTQLVGDVQKDEDYISLGQGGSMRSELDVPVKIDSRVAAVLTAINSAVNAFSDEDVKLVETLAMHVSSAISHIRQTTSLIEADGKFRALLEEGLDGVSVTRDGEILFVNQRFVEMLGYSDASDLIGKRTGEIVDPRDAELLDEIVERRKSEGSQRRFYEIRVLKKDGSSAWLEFSSIGTEFEGKPAVIQNSRDISGRKRLEEELRTHTGNLESMLAERTRKLLVAERMAAASRVTAMLGHDLRAPLVTIGNAADLAMKSPENAERMLTMIKRNADKSITMLEELRERLREKPILLEMTDLGALILKAIEDTLIPDSVNTILRLDEKLGPFMLDASQMRRVLHNLIGNALDAMPGGGELTISSERDGETVLLEVSDTGGGISEDDMKDLFSPFHSKKSGGLGLGLAFCKQTVEAHNGSITVESEIGQGTKIEIVIPMNE
jgi:PAS domain S-box-containing protein